MAKLYLGVLVLAAIAVASLLWWNMSPATTRAPEFRVVVYDRGKKLEVAASDAKADVLVARCEEQLRMADSVLRLAVTPSLIQELQRSEVAVEIVYGDTKTFASDVSQREVRARRLLIPVTGELAGEVTTIFYGTADYGAGPYRNKRGTKELRELIKGLGIRFE